MQVSITKEFGIFSWQEAAHGDAIYTRRYLGTRRKRVAAAFCRRLLLHFLSGKISGDYRIMRFSNTSHESSFCPFYILYCNRKKGTLSCKAVVFPPQCRGCLVGVVISKYIELTDVLRQKTEWLDFLSVFPDGDQVQ